MNRLIRRAISAWQSYQTKRRLYRAFPAMRELDQAEREARRRHAKGVNEIRRRKAQFMTEALRGRAS